MTSSKKSYYDKAIPVITDTDCLSSFLSTGGKNLLLDMFDKVVVPIQVDHEISKPGSSYAGIKPKYLHLKANKKVIVEDFFSSDEEMYNKYVEYTSGTNAIGKGEAAGLVIAESKSYMLASNNMRDVGDYVRQSGIKHITSAHLIVLAEHRGLIDEKYASALWNDMLSHKIRLPKGVTYVEFRDGTEGQMVINQDGVK